MYSGIHNFSEIGKLNKVLLHRPGEELESLTPATLERLLFDDIPYLKVAQEEHDRFAEVLRENGVEVIYYVDEVAKAIADPARQIQLVNDFLNISKIHAKGLRASMTSLLLDMPPKQMVTKMIAGIKRCEVATKQPTSLMDLVDDDYPFVSDPMPNLYFTRDPGACVGEGINIHRMHTPARKRESLLLKYMFLYNRDFATQDNKMWYDLSDSYSIEGGDVLVLSKDIVAVGLSERTTVSGAETFARNLLQNSDFKKVLAFDIPETRAFMHLDTVFTMVDYDKFTIHPEIEGPLSVYEMTLDEHGELRFGAIKEELKDILALELKLPAVDLIRCGGGDLMAAQREQWNDGSNTLCIAPGRVITYERNYVFLRNSRSVCRADTVITVTGDSMLPTFRDGDELLVEYTPEIREGEIGIFVVAGEGFVKEYRSDGLHSHNPKYKTIRPMQDDNFRCVGRVLGAVTEDMLATPQELAVLSEVYSSRQDS